MPDQNPLTAFNGTVLPHFDSAYNLARWLTRNDRDAEDIVQEACLRAFKYWKGFSGGHSRSWLLAIVRNTYYSWLRQRSVQPELTEDGEIDDIYDGMRNPGLNAQANSFLIGTGFAFPPLGACCLAFQKRTIPPLDSLAVTKSF